MNEFLLGLELNPNKQYTAEEIKKQYRDLAKVHHPDKEGGDTEKFKKISHCYEMLTNPEYRQKEQSKGINLDFSIDIPVAWDDAFFGKNIIVTYNQIELDNLRGVMVKQQQDNITVSVNYPSGLMQGYAYKVPNGGLKHNGKFGDAVLKFMVKSHPKFQTDGANIISQEQVDLETMVKGGIITVQTMYGLKEVKVRPGTIPGMQLKIRGCGVNGGNAHIVVVSPLFPSEKDLKDKKKFSDLDIDWQKFEQPEVKPLQGVYVTFSL